MYKNYKQPVLKRVGNLKRVGQHSRVDIVEALRWGGRFTLKGKQLTRGFTAALETWIYLSLLLSFLFYSYLITWSSADTWFKARPQRNVYVTGSALQTCVYTCIYICKCISVRTCWTSGWGTVSLADLRSDFTCLSGTVIYVSAGPGKHRLGLSIWFQ